MYFSTSLHNIFCGRPHRQLTRRARSCETNELSLASPIQMHRMSCARHTGIAITDI